MPPPAKLSRFASRRRCQQHTCRRRIGHQTRNYYTLDSFSPARILYITSLQHLHIISLSPLLALTTRAMRYVRITLTRRAAPAIFAPRLADTIFQAYAISCYHKATRLRHQRFQLFQPMSQ